MSKQNPAGQIEALRERIRHHDRKYYVEAAPEISDRQYDKLIQQLRQLESQHPDLVTPDSPTQRIGDAPVPHLQQVPHRLPMLSIDNTYSEAELTKFAERAEKLLEGEPAEWVVELKVDGVAASVIYEQGLLTCALTRGDGTVGDDITHNVRTLADVPLRLTTDTPPSILEVRGEIFMTNDELVKLNERQQAAGQPIYANTRNVTAGSIRLLDPRIAAERNMKMVCHGVGFCEGLVSKTHMEFLDEIASYGIPATPLVKCFSDFAGAMAYCHSVAEHLHDLDFEVDGLVLKLNSFAQRDKLGARSKSPRWLVAYKWEKYEATTRLNEIQVQVGKTGAITPVAILEPVELAQTTVSRASLHNADEIARKDIRVGDTVVVEKAGKIIPHIVRVEKHKRGKSQRPFQFPARCPECDTPLKKDEGGVYIRCPNYDCPAQVKERIRYFATRGAMDIEGLGDKLVDQLVSENMVTSYGDLYRLTAEKIAELPRMGIRSSEKLVDAIALSKSRGLVRLLNALSIRHVGTTVAEILAKELGSITALQSATVEELAGINEVGDIIAQSVHDFLASDEGRRIINDLDSVGVHMEIDQSARAQPASEVLAGKTLVVTGTLAHHTRDEMHDLIKQHGGKPGSSISSKTSYLIAGEKAGSKREKADKLGVPVLSEDDFLTLIGQQ